MGRPGVETGPLLGLNLNGTGSLTRLDVNIASELRFGIGVPATLSLDASNQAVSISGVPVGYDGDCAPAPAEDVTTASPGGHAITVPLTPGPLAARQITELTVDLTVRRTGGAVWGELASSPEIRQVTTRVPAKTSSGGPDDPLGLTAFARDFELAMSGNGYWHKVGAGINRVTAPAPEPGARSGAVVGADRHDPGAADLVRGDRRRPAGS